MEENKQIKTGTTTLGIVCKDGIVLAADKRVTLGGQIIASKDFEKAIIINEDIALTVAGGVSDVQLLIKIIKAQLKLEEMRRKKKLPIKAVTNLLANLVYNNVRKMSPIPGITGFLLGGKGTDGNFYLYTLGVDGAITQHKDYTADGSGFMFALGALENSYKKNLTIEEGVKLAVKAISSAIQRDTASGSGIDVITITKSGTKKVLTKQFESNKIEI